MNNIFEKQGQQIGYEVVGQTLLHLSILGLSLYFVHQFAFLKIARYPLQEKWRFLEHQSFRLVLFPVLYMVHLYVAKKAYLEKIIIFSATCSTKPLLLILIICNIILCIVESFKFLQVRQLEKIIQNIDEIELTTSTMTTFCNNCQKLGYTPRAILHQHKNSTIRTQNLQHLFTLHRKLKNI